MRLPLSWLGEMVEIRGTAEAICDALTDAGIGQYPHQLEKAQRERGRAHDRGRYLPSDDHDRGDTNDAGDQLGAAEGGQAPTQSGPVGVAQVMAERCDFH